VSLPDDSEPLAASFRRYLRAANRTDKTRKTRARFPKALCVAADRCGDGIADPGQCGCPHLSYFALQPRSFDE
jgi:hypothetical protein